MNNCPVCCLGRLWSYVSEGQWVDLCARARACLDACALERMCVCMQQEQVYYP